MPYRVSRSRLARGRRAIRRYGAARKIQRAFRRRRYRRRVPIGMPAKQKVRLKYVETITLNPGVAGVANHYFSCNGMYDPNITGVGHAPLYFSQYMSNYDHYQVIGSAMKVTQMPTSGSDKTPAVWGIMMDNNTTFSYTDAAQIIESNQGKNRWRLGSASTHASLNNNGTNPRCYAKFSAKKQLGDLSDKHEGSVTSNPTDQYFYSIWCANPGVGTDPETMAFMVEISYIAILKEPKYVAQS